MNNLGKKRLEAIWAIASYAIGGSTLAATPTPGGEVPKQIVLTASDILMYSKIWKIYFEEDLSNKEVLEMLKELGLIAVAAAGTAYIVAQSSTLIVREIKNWIGPVGWGMVAIITGSLTGIFGTAWAIYCDRRYAELDSDTAG
ncbi:MAG TPA: hypothetical protein DCL61_05755 [Cyanobacteria bacterium UBA12227]|nr:hypothetical protein [Cyanobacteria bacterium UBA12227]HAX86245.1 hypothetical protein [Cyanobacteria bacterium UBA11370]HBY81362.1 hypothetical protein [Cyanobacteria bacterium UBA11148]